MVLIETLRKSIHTLRFVELIELFKKTHKAKYFFTHYAPGVKGWNHKLSGKNSKGTAIEFTHEDRKLIRAGLKKLFKDLNS